MGSRGQKQGASVDQRLTQFWVKHLFPPVQLSSCHSPGPAFTVAELGDMNNGPAPASVLVVPSSQPGAEIQIKIQEKYLMVRKTVTESIFGI